MIISSFLADPKFGSSGLNMHSLFSGSYKPEDVVFLLKPIAMAPTDTLEKERRIQSGLSHYSEMISEERLPSKAYLQVFHEAFERNKALLALNVCKLSRIIANRVVGEVTIVSLARAGTPVGVLLKRVLERHLGRRAVHYSISIIRDRGIDENALTYILRQERRSQESVVFVDGWTGKGVIARELKVSVAAYNARHGTELPDRLHVLSDLCGQADEAPSSEDYLIPSGVLNSTISGLISRSVLNALYISHDDFHGCVYYSEFEGNDLSNWFVDKTCEEIVKLDRKIGIDNLDATPLSEAQRVFHRARNEAFVMEAMAVHGVRNINYVKPGIGESTRVLLRRAPDKLFLRDEHLSDVQHLIILAREKKVPVFIDENLPYNAVALIQDLNF